MPEEYEQGRIIGEIQADVRNTNRLLSEHIKKQDEFNQGIDNRVKLLESWIQTTTGKVVILTTFFGIVGSLAYIGINWVITKYMK